MNDIIKQTTKEPEQVSDPPLNIHDVKQNANRIAKHVKADKVPYPEVENDETDSEVNSDLVEDTNILDLENDLEIPHDVLWTLEHPRESLEALIKQGLKDYGATDEQITATLLKFYVDYDKAHSQTGEPDPDGDSVEYPPIQIRKLTDIKPRTIEWLVPGWIPKRGITLIAGQPGAGKTTLALALAAATTRGGYWGDQDVEKGEVFLYCGEDTFPEVIVPNLMAQKADLDKIHNPVAGVDDKGIPEPFNPGKHIELLRTELKKRPGVRLLILDPALSIANKTRDEYRANDIRKALEPVQALADEAGIAIVCITHFLKRHNSVGSNILDRVIGSQAWGAVARMVLAVEQQNAGRACMRVKSNWGINEGGFLFDISSEQVEKGIEGKYIQFGAGIEGSADDVIGKVSDKDAPKTNEAIDWLNEYIDNQPDEIVWSEVEAEAKESANMTKRTIREAREQLSAKGEIESYKVGGVGGKWFWRKVDKS